MDNKLDKTLTILFGLFLPVVLTLILPYFKLIFANQNHYTGYLDGAAVYYLVKDFIANGVWAVGVLLYILWVIKDKSKISIISNVFTILCAVCGCYIVLIRSDLLNIVLIRSDLSNNVTAIDNSTYTLESILIIMACSLLIRKILNSTKK